MAEATQRRRRSAPAPEEERGTTRRVVMRREAVLVLPEGVATENIAVAWKALGLKGAPREVAAWLVVGEFEGNSKTKAIEAHAGKPGTPEAIPGAYKAPTVTAWAGGEEYVKPPEPKVERRSLG